MATAPAQNAGQRLKNALDDVVAVFPGQLPDVEGDSSFPDKGNQKFPHQFRVEGSDFLGGNVQITAEHGTTGNVHGTLNQRLVHGQYHVGVTVNAPAVAQRLPEGCAQGDADVLDAVVVVYLGVAVAGHVQVKTAMLGKEGQHVLQKAHAQVEMAFAGAVQVQGQGDIGFARLAGQRCLSHGGCLLWEWSGGSGRGKPPPYEIIRTRFRRG